MSSEPEWSVWVHDAKTGEPRERLDLDLTGDSPWSASIEGAGVSEVTIATSGGLWTPALIEESFSPNNRLLVRWWGVNGGAHPDDVVVSAHKIDDYDYDRDAGTVKVSAVDLIEVAGWRLIGPVGSDPHLTLTITGRSAEGAVAEALDRMMQYGHPDWILPIDLPVNTPGEFSGEWVFWKKPLISDVLAEIRTRMGVEVYLRPYPTASGGVRFQTLVAGAIGTGGTLLHLDAEDSPLAGVHYRVNGSSQVTGLQALGQGTGEDQKTTYSGGVINCIIRDTSKDFGDLVGDALQDASNTHYARNINPVRQWSIGSVTVGEDFPPALVLPGAELRLEVYGDPVIPDDVHHLRVLSVSGGNGRQLKPEVENA
jgi:hypothetical protein